MNFPKISIVIPSYNKVKYIKKTLDSIFNQNYSNIEVIVQDGGSTDGTLQIVKKYKVILESKKDKGQLDAICRGMKKATGDILTFINADDYYEKNTFKLVSEAFLKNPKAIWFAGRGRVVNKDNIEIAKIFTLYKNLLLLLDSRFYLLVTNYLVQPSVFYTKNAYKKFGPFTGTSSFVTEYELWIKLFNYQKPVIINKLLSNFRIEKDTKTKMLFNDILYEDEKIITKYTNNKFILMFHKIHNIGRKMIGRFI